MEKTDNMPEVKYYSEARKCYITIPAGTKHVLVFGKSKVGKSSVINMLSGRNKSNGATVGIGIMDCSFSTEPWLHLDQNNREYCFWDTAGLDVQSNGNVTAPEAVKNLIKLIRSSRGFHGAILVVNYAQLNDTNTAKNWELFYNNFLSKKIPVIICVTGRGMESSDGDDQWLKDQDVDFKKLKFVDLKGAVPPKCVIYSKDDSEITYVKEIYLPLKDKSIAQIKDIMKRTFTDKYYNPVSEYHWFDLLKRMWNSICELFPDWFPIDWRITIRDSFYQLLIKIGFKESEALEISKETL